MNEFDEPVKELNPARLNMPAEPSKLITFLLLTVFFELYDIAFIGDFFCDHNNAR